MTKRACEHPNCNESAGYVCDECECDFCEEHVKPVNIVQKDADDCHWVPSETGKYHMCEDCLNG